MQWSKAITAAAFVLAAAAPQAGRAEVSDRFPGTLKVEQKSDRLIITRDAMPVATYVFRDEAILRPYFANVHAPSGLAVTRPHPPPAGDDADHATMHPGIWLAFSDLSGADFWRNKGRVEHVEFVRPPEAKVEEKDGVVTFTVLNRYVSGERVICREEARYSVRATRAGYLFTFDSTFSSDEPFAFGDQEEMGLGVRLAAPAKVRGGSGAITNSAGGRNEKEVWGQAADWCDYSGIFTIRIEPPVPGPEGKLRAGLLVVPHPANFRRAWMHARDYGLLVANPFGQRAFTRGEESRIEVKPGETLRLRFGVWSYAANLDVPVDPSAMAAQYVRSAGM